MVTTPIDLGHGHTLHWVAFRPDRSIEQNRVRFHGVPDDERAGARVMHRLPNGDPCDGIIYFDTPAGMVCAAGREHWHLEAADPPTVTPSLLCEMCGDHGFIREGKWVPV